MSMRFFMTTQNSILYVHDSFISKSRDPGTLGRDKQVVAPTGIMIIGWISFRCLYICNFFFFFCFACMRVVFLYPSRIDFIHPGVMYWPCKDTGSSL